MLCTSTAPARAWSVSRCAASSMTGRTRCARPAQCRETGCVVIGVHGRGRPSRHWRTGSSNSRPRDAGRPEAAASHRNRRPRLSRLQRRRRPRSSRPQRRPRRLRQSPRTPKRSRAEPDAGCRATRTAINRDVIAYRSPRLPEPWCTDSAAEKWGEPSSRQINAMDQRTLKIRRVPVYSIVLPVDPRITDDLRDACS